MIPILVIMMVVGLLAALDVTAVLNFTIEKAEPQYTVPTGITAEYGDTLADVTLPSGWAWNTPSASVGNVGTNAFMAKFTPADAVNYNVVENVDVNVAVGKKTVTVTADNQTKVYGDADPEFTYTVDGLIGRDAHDFQQRCRYLG